MEIVRGGAGLGCLCSEILRGLESLGRHRPCGPGEERLCPASLSLCPCRDSGIASSTSAQLQKLLLSGFGWGWIVFSQLKKKVGGKDKRGPLAKEQVSVRTEGAESSAKCRPTA